MHEGGDDKQNVLWLVPWLWSSTADAAGQTKKKTTGK
jgi:hypothetical protein